MSAEPQSLDPDFKPTKVEVAKQQGRYLRGSIAEVLASEQPAFEHDDIQLLKFHGIYQQDDRDSRGARRALGREKDHSFMIRLRLPGGELSSEQYLALDTLAERASYNRSLRITTRQSLQLHGILKGHLRATVREINDALISTLAACGDVGRNVMASPAPWNDPLHEQLRHLAREISDTLYPRTGAYHEIWLDGDKVERHDSAPVDEREPLYGPHYLPRKFKTAIALPTDNSVDVHSQDVGMIAIERDGNIAGANLLVGGGLGMTHRKADTYARLGTRLGFVETAAVAPTVAAIAAVFRDHGNRSDRRHARLKYLLEDWGLERFRREVEARLGHQLDPWVEIGTLGHRDYLGAHHQEGGKAFFGLHVPSGRIIDRLGCRLRTAVREIVAAFAPRVILTPSQNLIFADLEVEDLPRVEKVLAAYRVAVGSDHSGLRRHALACPALPTCGLALTDAERALPGIVDQLEGTLSRLGLDAEPLTLRITGCPNGCARPYTADLGLVGRKPGHYDIYVGGRLAGDRLADLWQELVPVEQITDQLMPLLSQWSAERLGDEGLGDFFQRRFGENPTKHLLTGSKGRQAVDRLQRRSGVA